jgi:hypothetical protein
MSKGESRPRTNPEAKNAADSTRTLTHEELEGVNGGLLQSSEQVYKRSQEEKAKTVQ